MITSQDELLLPDDWLRDPCPPLWLAARHGAAAGEEDEEDEADGKETGGAGRVKHHAITRGQGVPSTRQRLWGFWG